MRAKTKRLESFRSTYTNDEIREKLAKFEVKDEEGVYYTTADLSSQWTRAQDVEGFQVLDTDTSESSSVYVPWEEAVPNNKVRRVPWDESDFGNICNILDKKVVAVVNGYNEKVKQFLLCSENNPLI